MREAHNERSELLYDVLEYLKVLLDMYSDSLHDVIFADFLHSVKLHVSVERIVEEAKELQRGSESVLVSNEGGYQSPRYNEKGTGHRALDELAGACRSYATLFTRDTFKLDTDPSIDWWMNISSEGAFNVPHNHGRTDLCGIYFAKVPDGAGPLILQRNDGSMYTGLFRHTVMGEEATIYPEEGRFYLFPGHVWHSVGHSSCVEDRISFSFNFRVL